MELVASNADHVGGEKIPNELLGRICRVRRKVLERAFSSNGMEYQKAGLIPLGKALFVLATRYLEPAMPLRTQGQQISEAQKINWESGWYYGYLLALMSIASTVQDAIRSGKIKLRNVATRASPPRGLHWRLEEWLDINIEQEIQCANEKFWRSLSPESVNWRFPDSKVLGPDGFGFDVEEFLTWLKDEKIARQDELLNLKTTMFEEQRKESSPAAVDRPVTSDQWKITAQALATEYIVRHKKRGLFPTQRDVCNYLESQLREEKVYGAQKRPLSATSILREAIQGEWWEKNKP